ncbi:phosphatase PAP2 family protein [Mycolicibacterium pulveris]|uniref:Phosphatase PAP2 family protein n=1 Tax=Mycolicibacterium pulveris TaxID=36813 RepID=A0A7I7UKT8_MYCPV|nr:phosphatase PAP2 family protein [Mycolicibacterium pulveris]BBY80726.1 phosphatase PAP2 family protein [Mycolicibacterium pulveris]
MTQHRRWLIGSAVAATAVYALLWIAQQWRWLTALDTALLDGFYHYGDAHPGWVLGWHVFCTVLGPMAFRVITLVVIVVALLRRNVRIAMFLLITVEVSGLVTEAAKRAADRPRPDTALVHAVGASFPSGHALGVMVAVLALLTVVLPVVRGPLRGWLVVLGAVIVVLIGLGRVVLNVHHLSDVLAGWALGYAYFAVCLAMVAPTRPITQPDEIPEAPGIAR